MLYVTTRNPNDVHTSHHAFTKDRSADQGLYVPFRLPVFSPEELESLSQKSFSETLCVLLKRLLGADLKSWDVDYAIGRNPVRLVALSHKIIVGETWRNLDWEFSRLEKSLIGKISGKDISQVYVSSWAQIAVRISVLFGLFSMLRQKDLLPSGSVADVAMEEADLSFAVSCVYCKKMGLPIGSIICSCTEDSPLWELYHTGQLQPIGSDGNMERLFYEVLGPSAATDYTRCKEQGKVFQVTQQQRQTLRDTISAVVVSGTRMESIIPSVYRTGGYILAPDSALAYGGLLDHRSRAGERRTALLLTQRSPSCRLDTVSKCMNMSADELKNLIFTK